MTLSRNIDLHYFGARYYSSDLSIWLSVDPLASKYPSTSPYMYVRGNPVMLIDPDGRSDSKFGKWLKNIFKGEKQDPIKQRYKISGPTITATRTKTPIKKDGYIKTKFKQFTSWLDNSHPFNEDGYGDPYYGAQKSGDPISNRNGDAGEMQTMPGGLIEIDWPFKNESSTQKDNSMIPYMHKINNPIPKELVPQSSKRTQKDPNEKIWIPYSSRQSDGSVVGGMSLEFRKDSLRFVNSRK